MEPELLLIAIKHGQHREIKRLHEKNGTLIYSKHRLGLKDNRGIDVHDTVLNFATEYGPKKTVIFLIAEFELDIQEIGYRGRNCFLAAIVGDNMETVKYLHSVDKNLIKAKDDKGVGALLLATAIASKEMVQLLIEKCDADVYETGFLGSNCFHNAVSNDKVQTLLYLDSICPELSQAKTNTELTAWDIAVDTNQKYSVEYLIEREFPDRKAVFLISEESCVKCCAAQPSVIFLPCNHTVACKNCVKTNYQQFNKCPKCKSEIDFVYSVELETVETVKKLKGELQDNKTKATRYSAFKMCE